MTSLTNARVLIVGATSGIGQRIAADLRTAGAQPIIAGRNLEKAADVAASLGSDVESVRIDFADESTIASAARTLGSVDHVISLGAAPANGPVTGLERSAIEGAFNAKVIGPILLAKHFAPIMRAGGAFVFFSGVVAWRPAPERAVMASANGAVAFLVDALALELAPLRAIAISPGIIDSGAWDRLGSAKDDLFAATSANNPSRRVGTPEDISSAVLMALTNTFITGTTLHVDGGGHL